MQLNKYTNYHVTVKSHLPVYLHNSVHSKCCLLKWQPFMQLVLQLCLIRSVDRTIPFSIDFHRHSLLLTHFRPMLVFTSKMFEERLWNSDILSKDAGHWSVVIVTPPQVFFKYFANKNQLPGLSVSGAMVENGLIFTYHFLIQISAYNIKHEQK